MDTACSSGERASFRGLSSGHSAPTSDATEALIARLQAEMTEDFRVIAQRERNYRDIRDARMAARHAARCQGKSVREQLAAGDEAARAKAAELIDPTHLSAHQSEAFAALVEQSPEAERTAA